MPLPPDDAASTIDGAHVPARLTTPDDGADGVTNSPHHVPGRIVVEPGGNELSRRGVRPAVSGTVTW